MHSDAELASLSACWRGGLSNGKAYSDDSSGYGGGTDYRWRERGGLTLESEEKRPTASLLMAAASTGSHSRRLPVA